MSQSIDTVRSISGSSDWWCYRITMWFVRSSTSFCRIQWRALPKDSDHGRGPLKCTTAAWSWGYVHDRCTWAVFCCFPSLQIRFRVSLFSAFADDFELTVCGPDGLYFRKSPRKWTSRSTIWDWAWYRMNSGKTGWVHLESVKTPKETTKKTQKTVRRAMIILILSVSLCIPSKRYREYKIFTSYSNIQYLRYSRIPILYTLYYTVCKGIGTLPISLYINSGNSWRLVFWLFLAFWGVMWFCWDPPILWIHHYVNFGDSVIMRLCDYTIMWLWHPNRVLLWRRTVHVTA